MLIVWHTIYTKQSSKMFLLKTLIFFVKLIKIVYCSSGGVIKNSLEVTHIVWFQIVYEPYYYSKHDYHDSGIVEFGLFGKIYPKTVRNFVELANETKVGAGFKESKLHVGYDAITGGYFEDSKKGLICTIYGRFYEAEPVLFMPGGQGWLFMYRVYPELRFNSRFGVTLGEPYGHTYGKVIRGMSVIKGIHSVYPIPKRSGMEFEVYISNCGVKIPQEKLYLSVESPNNFV